MNRLLCLLFGHKPMVLHYDPRLSQFIACLMRCPRCGHLRGVGPLHLYSKLRVTDEARKQFTEHVKETIP
jgi:hypothetical protein